MGKPGGEINDPNDIDIEMSEGFSDSMDDASEISVERNQPPDRI